MSDVIIIAVAVTVLTVVISAAVRKSRIVPGGVYSVLDGPGRYGVVKVLAVDKAGVHLRLYSNKYDRRPTVQELGTLELGNLHGEGQPGIGHLPVARSRYHRWAPKLMFVEGIADDELEGYNIWKEDGGGSYWG